ncbi:hypothetical protein DCS_05016 [Drechmeria coniospora]|uniref:Uncharacterized protein n=1 Tax=Drechmeria coniospora TaxID=98403 RepID=A0A151GLM1_DRECN|nr:hypothetical protein DCS_05016 [Drechmeria coniospora]KYK58003.1 hypothetical protein DCS_05016 [Drechmeria coniospora]
MEPVDAAVTSSPRAEKTTPTLTNFSTAYHRTHHRTTVDRADNTVPFLAPDITPNIPGHNSSRRASMRFLHLSVVSLAGVYAAPLRTARSPAPTVDDKPLEAAPVVGEHEHVKNSRPDAADNIIAMPMPNPGCPNHLTKDCGPNFLRFAKE